MIRKKSDYHILIAQNFLANISIDGTHQDTNLQMFFEKGMPKSCSEKKLSTENNEYSKTLKGNDSIITLGKNSLERSNSYLNRCKSEDENSNSNHSFQKDTPRKKTSIFKKIAKMMSSDDVIQTATASTSKTPVIEENIPIEEYHGFERDDSANTVNQFGFLKRLKSTITHADRYYVCSASTNNPFVIFSYLSPGNDTLDPSTNIFATNTLSRNNNKKRSKSIFGSADRMKNLTSTSLEELRPFIFQNPDDYVSLAQLRRKRNPSPFFTLFEKPKKERRESCQNGEIVEDLFVESIEIPQAINRNSSCERGSIENKNDDSMILEEAQIVEEYQYHPNAFEDIGMGKRTVIRLNCFIGTTIHFIPEDRAKLTMNENFEEKYPQIHLTMSKMKSLKREMLELAQLNNVDSCTLAFSYNYFEKVVGKQMISKNNRKCVAGACLLVAMKMNDFNKLKIKTFIQTAEDQLRESKEDLLSYELPLCTALKFQLVPPVEEIQPHLDRLQFEMF